MSTAVKQASCGWGFDSKAGGQQLTALSGAYFYKKQREPITFPSSQVYITGAGADVDPAVELFYAEFGATKNCSYGSERAYLGYRYSGGLNVFPKGQTLPFSLFAQAAGRVGIRPFGTGTPSLEVEGGIQAGGLVFFIGTLTAGGSINPYAALTLKVPTSNDGIYLTVTAEHGGGVSGLASTSSEALYTFYTMRTLMLGVTSYIPLVGGGEK